ncbi:MAG TPA: cytochrome ubiquinol oxidase subunit I [Candidatus Angelobacter sp.]|jgi:cytochrome d ubiquinol oxidase subunit I|nr:cytochrome ubiquinol oxidase subunit I [Candidatus Angelobacter sp.]
MDSTLLLHRLHFAFTVTFHYLFPQLTMGLAPLIVVLKTMALRTGNDQYNHAARFWARLFGINFIMGVVTGIPMEFQFGTNWSHFARLTGGVIGQPLVMEGVFAFFLESAFLGLFLYGEKRLSPKGHWWAAFMVFLGSWISAYFIIVTDAWMQHPVAFERGADGQFNVVSFWGLLLNPWALVQFAHNMCGAVITGAFVMAAIGAYYLLEGKFTEQARIYVRVGVIAGVIASIAAVFPTGDAQGRFTAQHQPVAMAAMEGLFKTETGAPIVILGQPDEEHQRIDNPLAANKVLSFLIYGTTAAEVKGLNEFPKDVWPTNIPLLYYSYHIMAGLGTLFVGVMALSAFLLWRGTLFTSRWMLWIIMLCLPFPYVANTAGWLTAEVGRQPWLVYGLMRTTEGYSKYVHAGNSLFTLIGFMGMYTVLAILFLALMQREIGHGPSATPPHELGSGIPITVA